MDPAIGELGAEEIWKEPVDRILSRLATAAAGLSSAALATDRSWREAAVATGG